MDNVMIPLIEIVNADTPIIEVQPLDSSVGVGSVRRLLVTATIEDDGVLSYEWYRNTTNSTTGGTLVGNERTYLVPTGTAGMYFYYAVVTNTNADVNGNTTATVTSRVAVISVTAVTAVQPTGNLTANPTASTVLVNGENVVFKLRDLAYVLNDTEKQFEVGWNAALNTITLTSGQPYTPVGGEMTGALGGGGRAASPTTSRLLKDSVSYSLEAYNIGGNNFFRLRDIAHILDFGVDWDGELSVISVDTSKIYLLPDGRLPPDPTGISFSGRNQTVTREVIMRGHRYDLNHQLDWRREADARIEQHRKADMSVTVLDANGQPVPDARVELRMTNHEFHFGGAVHGTGFLTNEARKRQFADMFNAAVFENYMKWNWETDANIRLAEQMIDWLEESDIKVRGHVLLWGAWQNLPQNFQTAYQNDPAGLRRESFERIERAMTRWGGRVVEWDVVNESYNCHDMQRVLGYNMLDDTVLANANITDEWFREARRISDANGFNHRLFYNDFGMLTGGVASGTSTNLRHHEWSEKFLGGLVERGVPIDGIGCQLYITDMPNPYIIYRNLERLSRFGLEIKVTEFAFNAADPKWQAEQFVDILTAVYSHELTTGFLFWWPWDSAGRSNQPLCGLFTENNVMKPVGEAFSYLVYGKWWTEESGQTGADGRFDTRGHFGEYKIIVTHNGETKTVPAEFFKDGQREFIVRF
jgi:GH35 family endo-1,4-beta-xylanase